MPFAVTLRLDRESAGSIADLRRRAFSGVAGELDYPPHVTLAITDGPPEPSRLEAIAVALAGIGPIPFPLSGAGIFPGLPATLWLAPSPARRLLEAHRATLTALDGLAIDRFCREDAWLPHVTLAVLPESTAAGRALAALHATLAPIAATLDRAELVRFPPAEILWSRGLS